MKTALYFDQSDAQLVLTAETEWEKIVLKMMKERLPGIAFEGGFYECQGGWIRHNSSSNFPTDYSGQSLMIRLPKKEEQP